MTNVEIGDLLDGEATRDSTEQMVFQQGAVTFRGSAKPNTLVTINAKNQDQLIARLGTNLIIPDGTRLVVYADDGMILDRPFEIGLDSTLEFYGATTFAKITYTGIQPMFQNKSASEKIRSLIVNNVTINGSSTGILFDIEASTFFFVSLIEIQDFVDVGAVECVINKVEFMGKLRVDGGIVFLNPNELRIISSPYLAKANAVPVTDVTVVFNDDAFLPLGAPTIIIDDLNSFPFVAGDAMVYFDPNSPVDTSYIIEKSSKSGGALFQTGPIQAAEVTGSVSGSANFEVPSSAGLFVGQFVSTSGFTDSDYNGTFRVLEIVDGTNVVLQLQFNAVDATPGAVLDPNSLNAASLPVIARDNPKEQDSMVIGGWFTNANDTVTNIVTMGEFVSINMPDGGGVLAFAENERFIVVDATNGVIRYTGLSPVTVTLHSVLGMKKTGSAASYNFRYTIDREGVDIATLVLPGIDYVDAESVTLTGVTSGATNATATISVSGGMITAITVVSSGDGYVEGETLNVIGGSGSGATATAALLGFEPLPSPIVKPQDVSTTIRDTVLIQEVVLERNHLIKIEIAGGDTTDNPTVVSGSMDVKG